MKKLILSAFAIITVIFLLQPVAYASKNNNTIVWTAAGEVDSADLYYDNLRANVINTLNMCDGLMHYDSSNGKYVPLLAKSYNWVNPVTLDIKLRKGVKFWNGKELHAKDVAYTLNHARQPDSHVVTRLTVSWIKDIQVLNPYELHIVAKKPTPAALTYLADETPIYPAGHYNNAPTTKTSTGKTIEDYGAVKPMCTGPYILKKFVPGSSITLVKNPDYFKGGPKGQPHIGKIIFRTISDTDSQMAALLSGQVDWIWSVLPQNMKMLDSRPNITVKSAPTTRVSFLSLDAAGRTGKNPIQKQKVRQAISYAIDKKSIVKNIVGPGAEVIWSICAPAQVDCTEDVPKYKYNPKKARKLLAEAGYPNGFKIDFYGYRNPPYANAVRNYLRQVGIKTHLRWLQWSALAPLLTNGKVALANTTWGSQGMMDVSAIVDRYFEFGPNDYTRDQKIRDWFVTADHETNPEKRRLLYKKGLSRIAHKAYAIPLFVYGRIYAFDSDLDYTVTPDGLAHFYAASWK